MLRRIICLFLILSGLFSPQFAFAVDSSSETYTVIGSLPPDEKPTIATVSDLEKLKDQQFFANARIGNKVFIFTQAKKAILYDVENNRIIEVAPLNMGDKTF